MGKRKIKREFKNRYLDGVHTHHEHPFVLRKIKYVYNIFHHTGSAFNDSIGGVAIDLLTDAQKNEMVEMIHNYAKNKKVELPKEPFNDEDFGYYDSHQGLLEYMENRNFRGYTFFLLMNHLNNRIEDLEKSFSIKEAEKRFDEISEVFKLSHAEKDVLILMYLLETDAIAGKIVEDFMEYSSYNNWPSQRLTQAPALAVMAGLSPGQMKSALRSQSNLMRGGLLDESRELNSELLPFLEGADDKPLLQYFFNEYEGNSIPLDKHTIPAKDVKIVMELAGHSSYKRGTNILLFGEPGTGKTEFARSLSKHLGRNLYEINFSRDEDNDSKDSKYRLRAFKACQEVVTLDESIILVDEADMLLNSRNSFFFSGNAIEKGMINNMLDESRGFNIWISNRADGMDESTLRRFDYSVKFNRLSTEQRIYIWQNIFKQNGLNRQFTRKDIAGFADQYDISAGGIEAAIRNTLKIIDTDSDKAKFKQTMESFLKNHLQLLDKKSTDKQDQAPAAKNYSIEGLNIKGDMQHILTSLDGYNQQWQRTEAGDRLSSLNLLFYGPPGTGKTEFAKYVSRRLKRKLIVRRPSDILDPYVGMTERRLRESFELAKRENAVLFIDEIDSFLGKRENSSHSWEVTQVNELLTNMEQFRGIFLAATNLKQGLDAASLRRFHFKLGFDFLAPEGNLIFYRRLLQKVVNKPLRKNMRLKLQQLTYLTPGDFYAVKNQNKFSIPENMSHQILIEALSAEANHKQELGKQIGFV